MVEHSPKILASEEKATILRVMTSKSNPVSQGNGQEVFKMSVAFP